MTQRGTRAAGLACLTAGHMFVDMCGGLFVPLIPLLAIRLDTDKADVVMLAGVCGIVVNAVQPLASCVPSRLRQGRFVLLALLMAAAAPLIGLTSSFLVLAVLAATAHVGIGLFHPDALMAAQNLSGSRDHLGVPTFLSGGFFGFCLAGIVSTQWVKAFGFGTLWILAIPGVALAAMVVILRLHRQSPEDPAPLPTDSAARSTDAGANGAACRPPFWLLFALSVSLATSVLVFYTFCSIYMAGRFGRETGVLWAGGVLTAMGLSSMMASFLWGHLSQKVSPFILIAGGQLFCFPLYFSMFTVSECWHVLAASALAGVVMGGAFFPVVATISRNARGMTQSLRAGFIVGGSWGAASLVVILCSYLIRHKATASDVLIGAAVTIPVSLGLALVLYFTEKNRTAAPPLTSCE